MIKVILRKSINGIGKAGEVKTVKDGFARNYLLARELAFIATKENMAKVNKEKLKVEQKKELDKVKAQELADKLSGFSCTISSEAHEELLYGSITVGDIAKAIEDEQQIKVEKKDILLNSPIKRLGIYEVEVKLHPEVSTKIKVWVVNNK